MKNSIAFRFGIAALLVSAGCFFQLFISGIGSICIGLIPLVLVSKSERNKPLQGRDLLIMLLILAVFFGLIFAYKFFVPKSADNVMEKFSHSPLFVFVWWILMMFFLFVGYLKRRKEVE
jgi:hypothetical protein